MTFSRERVEGIIFDYGGTIDSNGDHWSWGIWSFYRRKSVPITFNAFKDAYVYAERFFAKHHEILETDNFYILLKKKILKQFQFLIDSDILSDEWMNSADAIAFDCYNETAKLIASEISLLTKLKLHYPMVIVSNFYGNLVSVLEDFKILNLFDDVIESSIVGFRKPDQQIFELGIKALNLESSNIVVVGDSYDKDILPAYNCGCQTIWLKGLTWAKDDISNQSLADVIISDFHELEEVFSL